MTRLCRLCKSDEVKSFSKDRKRDYYRCNNCSLIFAGEEFYLTNEQEKSLYDFHQNTPDNQGYCNFLNQLVNPLSEKLDTGVYGLDFGCGPGPTLNLLFKQKGHEMDLYDPFYHNDPEIFLNSYDFITSSEVFEHLQNPSVVIDKILSILKPGGYLGVMTKLYNDEIDFKNWYYKNDMTHIIFFSLETIEFIKNKWSLDFEIHGDNVIIFTKR